MYYTNIYAGIDLPMREERKMGGWGEKKFKGFDNSSPAPEFDLILFQFSVIDG